MAIYERGRGFELGATEKQIRVVARAGLEPGTAGLRVRHADHSATLAPLDKHLEYPGALEQNMHVFSYAECLSQRNSSEITRENNLESVKRFFKMCKTTF